MTANLFETEVDSIDQAPPDPMSEPLRGSESFTRSDRDATPLEPLVTDLEALANLSFELRNQNQGMTPVWRG